MHETTNCLHKVSSWGTWKKNPGRHFWVRTLESLNETGWACRANAINIINCTIDSVIRTLKHVHETDTKANIASELKGLLGNIDFKTVLSLKVGASIVHMCIAY